MPMAVGIAEATSHDMMTLKCTESSTCSLCYSAGVRTPIARATSFVQGSERPAGICQACMPLARSAVAAEKQ